MAAGRKLTSWMVGVGAVTLVIKGDRMPEEEPAA